MVSAEWLVPPKHKEDFATAFLKTKEQVLKTNGGVKRVDLLEVCISRGQASKLAHVKNAGMLKLARDVDRFMVRVLNCVRITHHDRLLCGLTPAPRLRSRPWTSPTSFTSTSGALTSLWALSLISMRSARPACCALLVLALLSDARPAKPIQH